MRRLALGALVCWVGAAVSLAAPSAPGSLLAVPTRDGQVRLSWVNADGSGLRVERRAAEDSATVPVASLPPGATQWVDPSALPPGARFDYRVGAIDETTGETAWSPIAPVLTRYSGWPLSDWLNVKTGACGAGFARPCAAGDGITDDTEAVQRALNSLNDSVGGPGPTVLYFPNGTYRISSTLFLEGRSGVQLIGESPGGVVIQWDPASPGGSRQPGGPVEAKPMFHSDGNRSCTFRNLVWDGSGTPYLVGFDQSWCGNVSAPGTSGAYNPRCEQIPGNPWFPALSPSVGLADTANLHIDSVFRNAWIGLRLGHWGVQDEETSFRRCRFDNNDVGVSLESGNSLNEWFWDCEFAGNRYYGIVNWFDDLEGDGTLEGHGTETGGGFSVVRGRFSANGLGANPPGSLWKRADIGYGPFGQFTIRDSVSKGSGMFLFGEGPNSTSAQMTILNNAVDDYDPLGTHSGRAIEIHNSGPILLVDNRVDSGGRPRPFFAEVGPIPALADVFAAGNEWTVPDPWDPGAEDPGFRRFVVDDRVVAPFDVAVPDLPAFEDPRLRAVYTVLDPAAANLIVAEAAADPDAALVHFPQGRYTLDRTLLVPASQRLTLSGSGPSTLLAWGGGPGPMIRVDGHAAGGFTVRDLLLDPSSSLGSADAAIRVDDLNQEDSRVFVHHVQLPSASPTETATTGILLDGCDRTAVDVADTVVFGENARNVGLALHAGPQEQAGTAIWTGFWDANLWDFDVANGPSGVRAYINAFDEYSQHYIRAHGDEGPGQITIQGMKVASLTESPPPTTNTVFLDDFSGNLSLIGGTMLDYTPGNPGCRIEQTGSAPVSIQSIGNTAWWTPEFAGTDVSRFVRLAGKYSCVYQTKDSTANGCDALSSPAWVPLPDISCSGNACSPYDASDLGPVNDGLALLRTGGPPGFHDESGSVAAHQVNIDGIQVRNYAVGILLSGGIPSTPAQLRAVPTPAGTVSLSWIEPSGNADAILIQRASTGDFQPLGSTPGAASAWEDAAAPDGVALRYRIAATRDRTGPSAWSEEASARTPLKPPEAVTAALEGAAAARIRWRDASSSEDGYTIERAVAGGAFASEGGVGPGQEEFLDAGLDEGRAYLYRVLTWSAAAGQSTPSGPASVTTPPRPPQSLTASSQGSRAIRLRWMDVSSVETGYRVERAVSPGGPFAPVGSVGANAGDFTDRTVNAATTYSYRVVATAEGLPDSPPGNVASATTKMPSPKGLQAAATGPSSIVLRWKEAPGNPSHLRVERKDESGEFLAVALLPGIGVSWSDAGLLPGSRYTYRLVALRDEVESSASRPARARTDSSASP